jgi:hypothetical protein
MKLMKVLVPDFKNGGPKIWVAFLNKLEVFVEAKKSFFGRKSAR